MKILSWILLADLVLLASSAPSTSSGSQPEKAAQGTADGSPQFLYMQLLHDTLKDSNKYKAENKANGEGALLATSIEADSVTGPGKYSMQNLRHVLKHAWLHVYSYSKKRQ